MARRRPTIEGVLELKAQAAAARRTAVLALDDTTQAETLAASKTLDSVANSQLRQLNAQQEPVLVLPDNASEIELLRARQHRAVQRDNALYLPVSRSDTVALPNVLLRSALWSSANAAALFVTDQNVPTQGDASIRLTGRMMRGYDRRVLAACLRCMPVDQPLCVGTRPNWICVSVWQLSQKLRVAFGRNVHAAVLESLGRLDDAWLRVRLKGNDLPACRLLELDDDTRALVLSDNQSAPRGSDLVTFRIPAELAALFGPASWSAVSEAALHDHSGLPAWLASYYSTHAVPYPVKIAALLSWSGSVCDLREFRRRLKRALAQLQHDDVPEGVRVAAFELTDSHVTVYLARWQVLNVRDGIAPKV